MDQSPSPLRTLLVTFIAVACSPRPDPLTTAQSQRPGSSSCESDLRTGTDAVRAALERQYARNQAAFQAENLDSVMVLRSDSFSTVGPDGQVRDRAQMAEYTTGLFNAVTRWIELDIEIESVALEGMLARAETRQHLERMALRPDQRVHHVETWVAQRETWLCDGGEWKLHFVDRVRDQRRMVDSVPG
jgi:hypothetical protein